MSKMGRRKAMILTDIISIIGMGFCALSIHNTSVIWFLIGRMICGITTGLNTTLVPLYNREYSPDAVAGTTGTFNQLAITIGILATSLMGLGLGNKKVDDRIWFL